MVSVFSFQWKASYWGGKNQEAFLSGWHEVQTNPDFSLSNSIMDLNTSHYEERMFSAEKKHGHGDYAYSIESLEDWVDNLWNLVFMIYVVFCC